MAHETVQVDLRSGAQFDELELGDPVVLSLGINAPYGYVQPAPVYVQPQPVYYESAPVYYQPQPVYYVNRPHRSHDRRGAWGDADRDGVPNRYDRAPNNPYRR